MKEQIIRQVSMFASLPDGEVQRLAEALKPCDYEANIVLFMEGETADRFFILLEGEIEIIKALGTPDERLLGVRGAGSFIGEMGLFNPEGKRTASVRSRTLLRMLEITRAEFDSLLHRQPALAYEMVRVLSRRLADSENITIRDLQAKNLQLTQAYEELKAAHEQIVEKEKIERELEVAREIQRGILPRALPAMDGFEVGARMMPMRQVGGDFYDVIRLDDHRLGVAVGDVSDKGVPAALFMALTSSFLRAESVRAASPVEALRNVNRHLLGMNQSSMFVTMLYGVLDGLTREFHYVRAGHEPVIQLDASGGLHIPPRAVGHPLGLLDDPALDERRLTIPPGGTLVIYTDGVTETTNEQGEFLGLKRLCEIVRANHAALAQATCERIFDQISAYRGEAAQYDDITIVAIQSGAG